MRLPLLIPQAEHAAQVFPVPHAAFNIRVGVQSLLHPFRKGRFVDAGSLHPLLLKQGPAWSGPIPNPRAFFSVEFARKTVCFDSIPDYYDDRHLISPLN
jgi:hypothetical protein